MPFSVKDGSLVPAEVGEAEKVLVRIHSLLDKGTLSEKDYVDRWARLLEYPAPKFRRVALDIEVFSPVATRVPDPVEAPYEVICACLVTNDGNDRILLLRRSGIKDGVERLPPDTKV